MKVNFYNMIFIEDNIIPFIRQGIPVEIINNTVCINGLGKYRIFKEPQIIEKNDKIEEKFNGYSNTSPWIGKENNEIGYLYRAQINEDSLNFEESSEEYTYLCITTKANERITALNGKIFFRYFNGDEQKALIRFTEGTVVRVEKEEGLIMVELVDGKFICR